MIILDTNVLSEAMRPSPNAAVMAWMRAQSPLDVRTTAITIAEIRFGLACLPDGRRLDALTRKFEAVLQRGFSDRVLPFDRSAADRYGRIMADCRARGRPMALFDGQIAAIAALQGATLATRDTSDFAACGVPLVNPWERPREQVEDNGQGRNR